VQWLVAAQELSFGCRHVIRSGFKFELSATKSANDDKARFLTVLRPEQSPALKT